MPTVNTEMAIDKELAELRPPRVRLQEQAIVLQLADPLHPLVLPQVRVIVPRLAVLLHPHARPQHHPIGRQPRPLYQIILLGVPGVVAAEVEAE